MSEKLEHPSIFISAAEPSADLHAASLIRAVLALCPGARFSGVAGPKMQLAGCSSIYDMTAHSSMLMGAIGHVHHGYRMLGLTRKELETNHFDAAVVVDSPILNLPVAKRAKSVDLPVLYYIAPQLWAWAGGARISRVRSRVDRIACILPFEEAYFRSYGIEANYVGHPLFVSLAAHQLDKELVETFRSGGSPILAIMPGSRRHEAVENFPGQLKVARALEEKFPNLKILVSVANQQVKPVLDHIVQGFSPSIELCENANAELLSAADLTLVVSGTATLEAAYRRAPMIVMYNSSRLYQLVKCVISTSYLSLPNIIADREVVPEFMPYYTSTEPIIKRAVDLLNDEQARKSMAADLTELVKPFVNTRASDTTAKILLDLIESRRGGVPLARPKALSPVA